MMALSTNLKTLAAAAVVLSSFGWAPPAAAQAEIRTRSCKVDQVGVFPNRIHIKCVPDPQVGFTSAVAYYALPLNADARLIDSVIALAIAAKQTNKPMVLQFDMNDYASVPGCQGTNCRRLTGAALE